VIKIGVLLLKVVVLEPYENWVDLEISSIVIIMFFMIDYLYLLCKKRISCY
jgi:hypothetical protein